MDIQATRPAIEMPLAKVGINDMHVPVKYRLQDGGTIKLETTVSMYVSLSERFRGANLSRLVRILYRHIDTNTDMSVDLMEQLLSDFQRELGSVDSYLKFRFRYPIRRPSLISKASGWVYHPAELEAKRVDGVTTFTLIVHVLYQSTCPCALELSRLLSQGIFIREGRSCSLEELSQEEQARYRDSAGQYLSQKGTPHAQRSRADVTVRFARNRVVWIEDVVVAVEAAVKVPVQVVVRRDDEQELARLSALHPLFVEDAVRAMSVNIETLPGVLDFSVVANHYEGIHDHTAVAVNWKGVEGGLR